MIMSLKQKKIKIKLRIKLNHNIYNTGFWCVLVNLVACFYLTELGYCKILKISPGAYLIFFKGPF